MLNAAKTVIKENFHNRKRLIRLAQYESKSQNNGTWLGVLWNILNPVLQIFVYWFVFETGLQVKTPKDGLPYIVWMVVGIIPWFYISTSLQTSAISIYSFSGILKRVYIPLSIVPVKSVLAGFITHLWSMLVVFILMLIYRIPISSTIWQLPYYMLALICFLCGWGLLVSSISVLFKDLQKIIAAFIRLFFYISPVVWDPQTLENGVVDILKYNPLSYVLNGYRNCILYGVSVKSNYMDGIYFWSFTIILFLIGSSVHMKFRKKFMDLI